MCPKIVPYSKLVPGLPERWDEIVRYSGLPPEACDEIAACIKFYRAAKQGLRATPGEARDQIGNVAARARELAQDLAELSKAPRAVVCLALGMTPKEEFSSAMDEGRAQKRIKDECDHLQELAGWLDAAGARVARGKTGAHENSVILKMLVLELDRIMLRHTRRGIARSTKRIDTTRDYVITVCKIADPRIGKGAIDEAMKAIIKARHTKNRSG